jgi:hypothetical protein
MYNKRRAQAKFGSANLKSARRKIKANLSDRSQAKAA